MKNKSVLFPVYLLLPLVGLGIMALACSSSDSNADDDQSGTELNAAFTAFDEDNTDIYISGNKVIIETNGRPNHTSPYWSSVARGSSTNHPLYVAPTVTTINDMAPGDIDDFNGSYTLSVPVNPQLANSPTATSLGPIGIAVSGAMLYNDKEGPNVPIDNALVSLDYTAAHTGPMSYHYHLEPHAWSTDDDSLIGIIADGFFIYGRKCASTGNYPTNLDASGGHTSTTQYSDTEVYHYHIQNELYLNQYYIIFPGSYQGTLNSIF